MTNATLKVYLGELTPDQMQMYNAEYVVCRFCKSNALVIQHYVADVVCEDCGKWQGN